MAYRQEEENKGLQILKRDLREKTPGRLYLFYGEEVFLLHHYLEQLHKKTVDELTEAFNFHRLNGETFDLQTFADAVENLPMMAERTMVQVDDVDIFKLPESDRERMTALLADIPEYCTVVFTYITVEYKPDKRYKKLWEAIEKNGQSVEFPQQSQRDLIAWIGRHFAAHGKRISGELCVYLMELTGGLMTGLKSEIEKIAAYSGAEEIVRQDIDAVVEPVLDAIAYQMTDQLAAGQYGAALQKLQQLLKMQEEPLGILGAVGSHFRRLGTARTLTDHGGRAPELAKLYGIPEFAARKAMDAARRFQPAFYRRAAELVLETDYAIKTSYDAPERLLELLVLRLAQEAAV